MSGAPAISVVMPVHNAEQHLAEAISSVLAQTYTDLELIIIDDGSTDGTAEVAASFNDPRIRIERLPENQGIVRALNRGIELARAPVIARMDGDDVMRPERLAKQLAYLNEHPDIDAVASFVDLVNDDGENIGVWDTDRSARSVDEIRATMPRTNCIAHPSIMLRAEALRDLRYEGQAEDWDLWMRLLARGRRIGKIPESLLAYRIHSRSLMAGQKRQLSLERRLLSARHAFLWRELGQRRFGAFHLMVVKAQARTTARLVLDQLIRPLARDTYRLLTYAPWTLLTERRSLKRALEAWRGRHLFLFPYVHTGGAEQVHADILQSVSDRQPLCLITGFSKDKSFLPRFEAQSVTVEIPRLVNHPWTRRSALALIARALNAKGEAHLLASNCSQFFDLLGALSPAVRTAYLQHAFLFQPHGNVQHRRWLRWFHRVDHYIFIAEHARSEFRSFLRAQGITSKEMSKLVVISNRVHDFHEPASSSGPMRILFVGRDSPEKRPELFLRIAERLSREQPGAFTFTAVGIAQRSTTAPVDFTGAIATAQRMQEVYNGHDILVLTSDREGFPLVVQEAMAHGLGIAATPVGDIPFRLGPDCAVITSAVEEETVSTELTQALIALHNDRNRLMAMRTACYAKARSEYDGAAFTEAYRSLLAV